MKIIISVIIPVYNTKDYLCECVSSVINQTYRNWELLLIDDGSTDGSSQLCDKLAKDEERITVIHKSNGGVSSARNAGIKKAHGEYLMFIDADDWIEHNYLEVMYKQIVTTKADCCFCNKYFKDNKLKKATNVYIKTVECTDIAIKNHLEYSFIASPCFSLVRTNKNCLFDEDIQTLEDWEYNFRLLCSFGTFTMIDQAFYHYRTVNGSASQTRLNERHLSCFLIPQKIEAYLQKHHKPLKNDYKNFLSFLIYQMLAKFSVSGAKNSQIVEILKKKARSQVISTLKNKDCSLNLKASIIIAAISPYLFRFFFNIKYRYLISKE